MPVCLRCGYDLRATPVEAPCPECGLAAHRSVIEHSHPDDCPPGWVGMIAAASVMLLISYVGFGLFLVTILLSGRSYQIMLLGVDWLFVQAPWLIQVYWGLVALAFLHAAANFLLSRDDRRHANRGISRLHGWALRVLPVFPILGLAAMYYLWLHTANNWWLYQRQLQSLSNWLLAVLVLCTPITFFRLRWLALRLSRPRLAEHVTIVAVGCAGSLGLMIACSVLAWGDIRHADASFWLLLVLPVTLVALFNLWAMLLLFVVSQRFLQSARESRARWQAADASQPGN